MFAVSVLAKPSPDLPVSAELSTRARANEIPTVARRVAVGSRSLLARRRRLCAHFTVLIVSRIALEARLSIFLLD